MSASSRSSSTVTSRYPRITWSYRPRQASATQIAVGQLEIEDAGQPAPLVPEQVPRGEVAVQNGVGGRSTRQLFETLDRPVGVPTQNPRAVRIDGLIPGQLAVQVGVRHDVDRVVPVAALREIQCGKGTVELAQQSAATTLVCR